MKILIDKYMPKDTAYLFNEDLMYYAKPISSFSLLQRILHFFGKHYYVWYESQCQYYGCEKGSDLEQKLGS